LDNVKNTAPTGRQEHDASGEAIISEIITKTRLFEFKSLFSELVMKHQKRCFTARFDDAQPPVVFETSPEVLQLQESFRDTMQYLNNLALSGRLNKVDSVVGHWIYNEMFPYVHIGSWSDRALKQPFGPGDHYTTSQIYDFADNEHRYAGQLINSCFMQEPAAKAIRNRKKIFTQILMDTVSAKSGEKAHVTSIGCGPAKEVFETYRALENESSLAMTCIDLDARAVDNIVQRKRVLGLSHLKAIQANILTLGTQDVTEQQDLVYSIGLMDYFSDKHVIRFLNKMYDLLVPGGRCIIGNYETANPTKALMDYVLKWPVYHRSETDMTRIFASSRFASSPLSFFYEPERVNLFAESIKR